MTFGLFFGIIAALTFFFFGLLNPLMPGLLMIMFFTTSISGLAGLFSVLLDKALIRYGFHKEAQRNLIIFITLIVFTVSIASILLIMINAHYWKPFLWGTTMGCCFGAVVITIYIRLGKYHEKVADLEEKNRFLSEIAERDRALKEQSKKMAVADERTRIARDLHDSISQGVHGLVYLIHSLRASLPPENQRAAEIADQLEKTVEATLSELKVMIMELKPSSLEEHGLTEALKIHIDLFAKRTDMEVALNIETIPELSPDQETAIYRIVQEGLANIQKHSHAKKVFLSLIKEAHDVTLLIQDDGIGFAPDNIPTSGDGLKNMAARCRENKGEFHLSAGLGQGAHIKASFRL